MRTYTQVEHPETYGKNVSIGNAAEDRAAKILTARGFTVRKSEQHPHGAADLIAVKGDKVIRIQVKSITSRNLTPFSARRRLNCKPWNLKHFPPGISQVWLFNRDKLFIFDH